MPLKTGDRLGPYEILALAGVGGMGEVYKARDSRLDRVVALKILPAHLAANPSSRERFEREARAISSLTHPNICALYDLGESDGTAFLAMEYVEGESLAQRVARGPLPLQQVIRFGAEICNALDAAHRRGIIHRDLKPGNIMITRSGVKLLDFGLAKLTAEAESAQSQTARMPITEEGAVVGTLQYMAPELLEGKPADARSDIFAAGTVLYEMLTGKRAFDGNNHASIITAILHSDPPPVMTLQPLSPPALERVIRPCLAKDPEHRWQTAHDVGLQLQGFGTSSDSGPAATAHRPRRRWAVPLAAAVAGALLAAAVLMALRTERPRTRMQLSILIPPGESLYMGNASSDVAISPDATRIVFATGTSGTSRLWTRSLAAGEAVALTGTEGAVSPFFSPDGKSVAFFANGRLKSIAFGGGTSDLMASTGPGRGGVWLPDGSFVLSALPGGPLERVNPDHTRQAVTTVAEGEAGHNWPAPLPGGTRVLFTCEIDGRSFNEARIEALDLKTLERKVIIDGGSYARFVPPDRLLYARNDRLFEVAFDPDALAITGEARVLAAPLLVISGSGAAVYDVARDGTIVFAPNLSSALFDRRLLWSDRAGRTTPLPLPPRIYFDPRISPNGKKLLVEIGGANDDLWVADLARGAFSRLTFKAENLAPVWMPDSSSVVFSHYTTALPDLYLTRADGRGELQKFFGSGNALFANAVTAAGDVLAVEFTAQSGADIVLVSRDRKLRRVVSTPFNEWMGDASPDGQWVVYSSEESGRDEVYVQPIAGTGEKTQLSSDGGGQPAWSRDGREIFYRTGDAMMVVDVSTANGFTASAPRLLFRALAETEGNTRFERNYDVTPDGQRFLFVQRLRADSTVRRLDVIVAR